LLNFLRKNLKRSKQSKDKTDFIKKLYDVTIVNLIGENKD